MFGCVYACDCILGKMNGCMHDAIVACNEKFLNSAFSLSSMFTKPSSGIRAIFHIIYMLNLLVFARVVNMVNMQDHICKSCEYDNIKCWYL